MICLIMFCNGQMFDQNYKPMSLLYCQKQCLFSQFNAYLRIEGDEYIISFDSPPPPQPMGGQPMGPKPM